MSIKKNITGSYTSQIVNVFVAFISSIYLTRLLGTTGRGEYVLYINALTIATVFLSFGLPSAIIYFISNRRIDQNRLFISLLAFNILISLVVLIFIKLIELLSIQHFIFPENASTGFYKGIFLVQFLFTLTNTSLISFLNARKYFITTSIITIGASLAGLIFYLIFYYQVIKWNAGNFTLIVSANLIVVFLQTIVLLFYYRKYIGIHFGHMLQVSEARKLIGFSLIAFLCNAIQFLTYRADLWFVDYYRDKATVGIYSLAVNLAQLLWILPNAIAAVLFSYIAGCTREKGISYTLVFTKISFYASLFMGLTGYAVFYFGIPVIYGNEFAAASGLIGILFLGIVPFSIAIIFGSFFAGSGNIRYNLVTSILGFIGAIFFYYLLIPGFGSEGAAWASVISYWICTLYMSSVFRKISHENILKIFIIRKSDFSVVKRLIERKILGL